MLMTMTDGSVVVWWMQIDRGVSRPPGQSTFRGVDRLGAHERDRHIKHVQSVPHTCWSMRGSQQCVGQCNGSSRRHDDPSNNGRGGDGCSHRACL